MTSNSGKKTGPGRNSYGKTAKVGILWTGFRRVGAEVVGIPTTMILARLLTPEEFGIATVGRIFLQLAEHATQVGFPAAMVRIKVLRPEHMSTSLVFGLGVGTMTWLALTGLAPMLASFFDVPEVGDVLPVAALAFLITPWGATGRVPIVRDMRFRHLAAATWVTAVAQGTASVVLAWAGFGFWSLVYGHLCGVTAGAIAKLYLGGWRPRFGFSMDALRELWSYGVGRQMKGLLRYLGMNIDSLIIGRILGMSSLGIYDKAFQTVKRLTGRIDVGQGAAFRIFAIIHEDPPRFQKAYRKLALARTVIACPIFLGAVAVAPQLFSVLYGPAWLSAVPAFRVLCAFSVLQVLNRTAAMANEAVGFMWWQVLIQAISVVLVATGVLVGSRFGVIGAAWGLLSARVISAGMVHVLVRRTTGLGWRQLFAPLFPAVLTGSAISVLLLGAEQVVRQRFPGVGNLSLLGVQTLVAAPLFLGLLLYSPFSDVRSVASETVSDFFPSLAKRLRLV